MKLPRRPTPPESDLARQRKVDEHLTSICQTLGVSSERPGPADIVRVNRRFGEQLRPIAEEALVAVRKCQGPFAALPLRPDDVRAELARLADLEKADAALERARGKIRDELNLLRVRVGGAVGLIHEVTTATLAHPLWDPEEKARLDTAAGPFLAAIAAREAGISQASQLTRSKNEESAAAVAEARAEAARLELENKFLSGKELRPRDVSTVAAAPAAPAAARRRARGPRRTRR